MSNSYMLIIYVVVFIGIFYFMAIRPQQRQRKAHMELLNSLKKGDTIVTAAGMYGTVKKVDDQVVEVEIAKGVTIKVARRAVAEIIRDRAEARAVAPARGSRAKAAPAEIEEETPESVEDVVEDAEQTDEDDESQRS